MVIDATSPQGNAFYIIGAVKKALQKHGRSDKINEVMEKMTSGDYDNLCEIAEEETADLGRDKIRVINR